MNPFQKASARRKAFYLAAILALFTVSIFYRGLEAKTADGNSYVWVPFGRDDQPGGPGSAARATILSQARRHDLRELEQGDPELAGMTARQLLTGSRGFAVAYLWHQAIDKQKRNDFHEMELLVRQVTALQPNFLTPWLFQSWNVSYNVSVEMHGLGDMYFYIARGIELAAEGERRNKRSPDMRYWIAFYYQNKFGVADQVQTLRCLYQLSCIPPAERDPKGLCAPGTTDEDLAAGRFEVDPAAFLDFCKKHPHLVRRLRGEERRDKDKDPQKAGSDTLRTRTPPDVVEFLRANRTVPSRFKGAGELADPLKQFPVLPPRFNEGPDEAYPGTPPGDDGFTAFGAARAWFAYANTLVPPQPRDEAGNPLPWGTPRPGTGWGEYNPREYRVPRSPMLVIFKLAPARAQTYQAEMEGKDGWFDAAGWEVDAAVDESDAWFTEPAPGGGRRKVPQVLGTDKPWSLLAWQEAARLWRKLGEDNGLVLTDSRLRNLREEAGVPPGSPDPGMLPPDLPPEVLADPAVLVRWRATGALFFRNSNRQVTNLPYYVAQSEAESKPETVAARKALWQADLARRAGNRVEAIKLYQDGLGRWKQVLLDNPGFHRPERSDRTEEETYEYELEYLRLIAQDDPAVRARAQAEFAKEADRAALVLPAAVAAAPAIPADARQDWYTLVAEKYFSPFAQPMPADLTDGRAGSPWVQEAVKDSVLIRQGIHRRSPMAGAPPGMGPGMMPGGRRPPGPGGPAQ
ncbi:MAG: hypothetical protein K2X87_23305, partial [Gemmataceae bacterium]|nr:hypothetical protein [Gemmataceae bacterium]